MRRWPIVLVVLSGISAILFFSDERNRHLIAGQTYLSGQAQFVGVGLGTNAHVARRLIHAAGFEEDERPTSLRNCGGRPVPDGAEVVRFLDTTWRYGRLCIVQHNGVVVALNISYGGLIT